MKLQVSTMCPVLVPVSTLNSFVESKLKESVDEENEHLNMVS